MNSGALRHRLHIQSKTETRDARGGVIETWTTVAERWGMISPLRMREIFQAQQVEARVSHRITLRYYAGLTNQHRVVHENRIFHIQPPINVNERNRETELLAMEET